MKNILKKLVPSPEAAPKPRSEIFADRAREAEAAGIEADREARQAEARLRAAILADDPAEISAAEDAFDVAAKAARRHKFAAEEFQRAADIALTEERERLVLDEADAADREAAQAASDLARQYPELARKLSDLLERVQNSENRCREAEALLVTIGKHRHIAGPQERCFPGPAGLFVREQVITGVRLPELLGRDGTALAVPSWPVGGGIPLSPPPQGAAPEPRPHPGGRGPWG